MDLSPRTTLPFQRRKAVKAKASARKGNRAVMRVSRRLGWVSNLAVQAAIDRMVFAKSSRR